jgi:beta-lactamase class A
MRHGVMKPLRLTAVFALAAVIAGCTVIAPPSAKQSDPGKVTKTSAPKSSPSPASSHTHSKQPPRQLSPFVGLSNYLASRQGSITAAVLDKTTGQTWVYRKGVAQDTASIVKVEIMGTALWEARTQGTQLTSTDKSLMTTMIENSDNNAATAMWNNVGGPSKIAQFDRLAGLTDTTPSSQKYIPGTTLPGWGLTTTTALDEVKLVSKFAFPNTILTSSQRQYGLGLMEHIESDQDWGVSGGVPSGATVALKNGWLPLAGHGWQVNSIGWVHGQGRNYVLAVLTVGNPDEQYGIDTIEHIASSMYGQLGATG